MCKGKVHPRTGHEGLQVKYRYSSTLSLTSALDGVGGQRHAPAALPPRKTRYPLYRRLDGPQGLSGLVRKISPLPAFDHRTVQPVASRYTDCAIPAHICMCICPKVSYLKGWILRAFTLRRLTWKDKENKSHTTQKITGNWTLDKNGWQASWFVILIKEYWDDRINEDVLGGTRGMLCVGQKWMHVGLVWENLQESDANT
jgi:hypothetical protein